MKFKKFQFCLFALSLQLFFFESKANIIRMKVGESYKIKSTQTDHVEISKKGLLDFIEKDQHLVVVARKPGSVKVETRNSTYDFIISPVIPIDLKTWVDQVPGLTLTIENHKLLLSGELLSIEHLQQINHLKGRFQGIIDNTTISKFLERDLTKRLNNLKESQNLLDTKIKKTKKKTIEILYNKSHQSDEELKETIHKIEDLGLSYEIKSVNNSHRQFFMTITFAEISRNESQSLGLKWPSHLSTDFSGNLSNDPLLALNALVSMGFGHIHAQPSLVLSLKRTSEFHSGGEIPIKVSGYKSQKLYWKKYGLILAVTPALTGQLIDLEITLELSRVDSSQIVDGIPGFKTHRSRAQIITKTGKSINLSGLIKKEWTKSKEGLSLLSQIPILGSAFKTKDIQEDYSQLIIIAKIEDLK